MNTRRLALLSIFALGLAGMALLPANLPAQPMPPQPPAESDEPPVVTQSPAKPAPAEEKPPATEPPSVTKPGVTAPSIGGKPQLPWSKAPVNVSPFGTPMPGPAPTTAREMFALFGLEQSRLNSFFSGQPIGIDEEELLAKILYRLPRFGLAHIDRWRRTNLSLDQLAGAPDDLRTEVVPLRGRVKKIEQKSVTPELSQSLEFGHYYFVTLALEDAPYVATVAVRDVPKAWLGQETLDEPAGCDGMFFKLVDPTADPPELLFAALHLQWFPEREYPDFLVGPDQVRLAKLGFDVSLLDDVRRGNRRPLGDTDREAFYQLLSLLRTAPPEKTKPQPGTKFDVAAFLTEPDAWVGRSVRVSAVAARISKVPVLEPDVRQRFGVEQYYQIDLLLPLDKQGIKLTTDKSGKNDLIYQNDFPATLCVLDLPAGIQPVDNVRLQIEMDAVYFKTWTYHSAYTDRFDRPQLAPLFVGRQPSLVKLEVASRWLSDALVFTALGLSVLVIAVVLVAFRGRKEQPTEDHPPPSFSGLENVPTKPDFAKLADAVETTPPGPRANHSP